jgi:hypothetical protein
MAIGVARAGAAPACEVAERTSTRSNAQTSTAEERIIDRLV